MYYRYSVLQVKCKLCTLHYTLVQYPPEEGRLVHPAGGSPAREAVTFLRWVLEIYVTCEDIRDVWRYTWHVEIYKTCGDICDTWRVELYMTCGDICDTRRYTRHDVWIQGGFFNWSPPKLSMYKSIYNLWHLEKFRASLHVILYLENLGGFQLKKTPCMWPVEIYVTLSQPVADVNKNDF